MKYLYLYIVVLFVLSSCSPDRKESKEFHCSFNHLYSKENTNTSNSSQKVDLDFTVQLEKNLKLLPKLNIDGSLKDEIIFYQNKNINKEYVDYDVKFIQRHNAIIETICGLQFKIEEETDSVFQNTLKKKQINFIEKYFNLLIKKEVFEKEKKTITVKENKPKERKKLEVVSTPQTKKTQVTKEINFDTLSIFTNPENAKVTIDDTIVILSSRSILVSPSVKHNIKIEKTGFQTLEDVIYPTQKYVYYDLEKIIN